MEEKKTPAAAKDERSLSEEELDAVNGGTGLGAIPRRCKNCGNPYFYTRGENTWKYCEKCWGSFKND